MSAIFHRHDFGELIEIVAYDLGINPVIVEKDYFVTEALRHIARQFGGIVMFKGGTSLSKGWGLIHRFSEDIDLFIDPEERGEKARESLLKSVIEHIASADHFEGCEKCASVKGLARSARLHYPSRLETQTIKPSILIELGIQSGTFPHEVRQLTSLLAVHLTKAGKLKGHVECQPFDLKLLHFRRTFIEKMFALHDKVERPVENDTLIGNYARHYYDLSQLMQQKEVEDMLSSSEYSEIVRDYHAITSRYFKHQIFPEKLELAKSQALFPPESIKKKLEKGYEAQCRGLCYRPYPAFSEVLEGFKNIQHFLIPVETE